MPMGQHGDSEKKGDTRGEIQSAAGSIYSVATTKALCRDSDINTHEDYLKYSVFPVSRL